MILSIRRTGGFAGIQQDFGTVDTAALNEEMKRAFASRLQDLTRLAATPDSPAADQFHYEVEVEERGQPPRVLVIVDEGDPEAPSLRALTALMETLDLALS